MSILFSCQNDPNQILENQLRQALPEELIYVYPNSHVSDDIEFAVVWGAPDDFFENLNKLKAIFSIAAGVDHILRHPTLPSGVPIVRLLDAGMGEKMAEYVLYGVLHSHRRFDVYRHAQSQSKWMHELSTRHAKDINVGILGLGTLGQCVAKRLVSNGYRVLGWSREAKTVSNVQSFAGATELDEMLSQLHVLVCLLPLTSETQHILNKNLFAKSPSGLFLINLARGAHLVDEDLLDALHTGQISGALLDVTEPEPPADEHPFWQHPDIILTPHIAGPTQEQESIEQIANNIKRVRAGEPLAGLVDQQRGY